MTENSNGTGSSGNSGSDGNSRVRTRAGTRDVRVLDKAGTLAERTKEAAIRTRQNTQSVLDDSYNNETTYAQDRMGEGAYQTAEDARRDVRNGNRKIKDETRKQVEKKLEKKLDAKESANGSSKSVEQGRIRTRDQARSIRTRESVRRGSETIKTTQHSVKGTGKSVKTAEQTSRMAVKTSQKAAQATREGAQAAAKASERAAIAAKDAAAAAGRAVAAAAKAVAAAFQEAAAALWKFAAAAGAAIAASAPFIALGIVIIAVAVLCTGDTVRDSAGVNTTSVIADINAAWQEELTKITSLAEDVTIEGGRATWPQIFSLYTARSDETSVDEWDEKNDLSRIFWDMNWISYDLYTVVEPEKVPEADVKILMRSVDVTFLYFNDGSVYKTETETYRNEQKAEDIAKKYPNRKMHVAVTVYIRHRSVEEMTEKLGFTRYQMEHAQALLEAEFASFWQERIYGVTGADDDIVHVAITQLGNSGGWPYWEYAGYPSRVEWCACFVSWCAGQCGYVDKGLFINTGSPPMQVEFFKKEGHWMDGSGTPSQGMVIFFDWYNADFADHVGIVEKVENGCVYTIEGNSGDAVNQGTWVIGDSRILGYGWILE